MTTTIKIGDYIKFRATARGATRPVAIRKVNGFYLGNLTVAFHGYRDFIVRPEEVIGALPKAHGKAS